MSNDMVCTELDKVNERLDAIEKRLDVLDGEPLWVAMEKRETAYGMRAYREMQALIEEARKEAYERGKAEGREEKTKQIALDGCFCFASLRYLAIQDQEFDRCIAAAREKGKAEAIAIGRDMEKADVLRLLRAGNNTASMLITNNAHRKN